MDRRGRLAGMRVAVLATDGFEQVEVIRPMRRLRKEGAHPRIVSLRQGRIRGMNLLWPGAKLKVDDTVQFANPASYDALLLPGGFISPDFLRQNGDVLAFVRELQRTEKPIAVICHGAWVLISAGLVRGRQLTSWPGIADDVQNAGGLWVDGAVVRDHNWVSSRSPLDLRAFNDAMVELYELSCPREVRAAEAPRLPGRRWVTVAARARAALAASGIRLGGARSS